MKKTICIIMFIIIISVNIISNAVTLEQMQQKAIDGCFGNEKSNMNDVSGPTLTINKTISIIIPLLMNIIAIISFLLFVIGIVCIIKKQTKKGIIFIIIAIIIFFISGMFSLMYHPHHNIMP